MDKEDMSEILQKISSMMNQQTQDNSSHHSDMSFTPDKEQSNGIQELLANFQGSQNDEKQENNNFSFDLDMLMKFKNIMDSFQASQNSTDANLLMALKPYLNHHRQQKLEQYMQFLNISKILDAWNKTNGGVK